MNLNFLFFYFSIFFLSLFCINYFLKRFNISLDKETIDEKHKSLLRSNSSTPLSGTLYFLPIILFLFLKVDFSLSIFCSLIFMLGYFADLKIITSYTKRLVIQFFLLFLLFWFQKDITINTRIEFIDILMNYEFTRILLCTFFLMVLVNGYNFIDGTNCLCSLNFFIITMFIFLIINHLDIDYFNQELKILLIAIIIFLIFNFFGKNFLGDGAVYGLSFLLAYTLIKIHLIDETISPYFVANLFWYPAFENLFSILRRNFTKRNNYLPDNDHLHHLIFKFCKKKWGTKTDSFVSSLIGIFINLILLINYSIGYNYLSHTWIQVVLISLGISSYLFVYFILKKKLS